MQAIGWSRLAGGCILLFALTSGNVQAQDEAQYPNKPIRIVVPLSAGGAVDIMARWIGDGLNRSWRQPVLVENKPGAQGSIAAAFVAKAPNDGYTLLMAVSGISLNWLFFPKLPYDAARDFVPVAQVVDAPYVLIANPDAPFRTVSELVQWARSNGGKVNFASLGQTSNLAGALLNMAAGIDMVTIPYKGGNESQLALMKGEASVSVDPSALNLVKAGKLRALAVMAKKRLVNLPDVPTIAEAGYGELTLPLGPNGVFAPAGTPKAIVDKLNREINRIVASADGRKKILDIGQEPIAGNASPERYRETMEQAVKTWADIVSKVGFKAQ